MINKSRSTRYSIFLFFICLGLCPAELVQRFTLQNGPAPFHGLPLSVDIEGLVSEADFDNLVMYEVRGNATLPMQSQFQNELNAQIWFEPLKPIAAGETVILELHKGKAEHRSFVSARMDDQTITLCSEGNNILSYYHALHPVPEGVDPVYRRSAFIHPLYSPKGHVLTQIQPADHYHHYGIWNPWTKTHIEGKEVDFWNLNKKQGTVRFADLLSTASGSVFAGFKVLQEHVQFLPEGKERVAMNEVWNVRAFPAVVESPVWIIDLTCTLYNNLAVPIELDQYRYGGGLGFRATEQWTKDNCSVLTSEGKKRAEADGTRARWCDINGGFNDTKQTSGILFLSHPANREHPEPMRVWPENSVGGKGEMFFEFCPIRHKDWVLQSGKEYVLKYRMIVYDGKLKPETMEALWQNYTEPPVISRRTD